MPKPLYDTLLDAVLRIRDLAKGLSDLSLRDLHPQLTALLAEGEHLEADPGQSLPELRKTLQVDRLPSPALHQLTLLLNLLRSNRQLLDGDDLGLLADLVALPDGSLE